VFCPCRKRISVIIHSFRKHLVDVPSCVRPLQLGERVILLASKFFSGDALRCSFTTPSWVLREAGVYPPHASRWRVQAPEGYPAHAGTSNSQQSHHPATAPPQKSTPRAAQVVTEAWDRRYTRAACHSAVPCVAIRSLASSTIACTDRSGHWRPADARPDGGCGGRPGLALAG
jgi:hypothetical protein